MNAIPDNGFVTEKYKHALVISCSDKINSAIESKLVQAGIDTVSASTEAQAFDLLLENLVSYILIDEELPGIELSQLIRSLRDRSGDEYVPIIILAATEDEKQLSHFISAGCDDVLFENFSTFTLNAKIISHDKIRRLKQLYKGCENEQIVAQRILTNAINERSIKFDDIDILKSPKSIFSGDLFLTARHPDGSLNILMADFTGHGLSAAISGLPVADVFSAMTEKGFNLSFILENINSKLHTLLPTCMFMACSVLNISYDLKRIRIWNGGMPDIYIRKFKTGKILHRLKSSHLPLGIADKVSEQYDLITVEIMPGDQLILFTDGLTEALNEKDEMFGEQRLETCIQAKPGDKSVFTSIIKAFDKFRGDIVPMDDVTLACIPCISNIMDNSKSVTSGKTARRGE